MSQESRVNIVNEVSVG